SSFSLRPAPKDRTHQQVGSPTRLPAPLSRGSPGIDEVAVRRRGITSKRIGRNEPAYANAYSLLSRKARQHEAVAAVIAATTNDMPAPGFRPGTPGELQRRRRRALHQGVAGYTGHSDGIAVHAAHAFGGIYL